MLESPAMRRDSKYGAIRRPPEYLHRAADRFRQRKRAECPLDIPTPTCATGGIGPGSHAARRSGGARALDGNASRAAELPQLHGQPFVTDGGIETDLIFNRGIELRDFAAFPLVEDEAGRRELTAYYDEYAAIAADAGAGLLLDSPTWRASADWGASLGYSASDLQRVNASAIGLLAGLRDRYRQRIGHVLISGQVGPRDPAQSRGRTDPDAAAGYHRSQLEVFAAEGADLACAMTLDSSAEAIGITRAAHDVGLPVAISF